MHRGRAISIGPKMKKVGYHKDAWKDWMSEKCKYLDVPLLQWLINNIGPANKNWRQGGSASKWINGDGWQLNSSTYFDGDANRLVDERWVEFDDSVSDHLIFEFFLKFN
jgi:hypothetical protein